MKKQPKIPDAETRARNLESLREVCRGFDAVNLLFDEVIAQLEEQNRRSPVYKYRVKRAHKLLDSRHCK